jgi:hypothetical protein
VAGQRHLAEDPREAFSHHFVVLGHLSLQNVTGPLPYASHLSAKDKRLRDRWRPFT